MPPRYDADDVGLLMVFSEPGDAVELNEFHDWYDNEHVPLRTSGFASFRDAARYRVVQTSYRPRRHGGDDEAESKRAALDPRQPIEASGASPSSSSTEDGAAPPTMRSGWAALYTISQNDVYERPDYVRLRQHRSPREADVVSRLAVLDRRIYRLAHDSSAVAPATNHGGVGRRVPADVRPRKAREVERDAQSVVVHAFSSPADAGGSTDASPAAAPGWTARYEATYVRAAKGIPGWTRTRRFELVDALITGRRAAADNADAVKVPAHVVVTEFSTPQPTAAELDRLERDGLVAMLGGDGSGPSERRVMQLYRAWDPIKALEEEGEGQGEVGASAP